MEELDSSSFEEDSSDDEFYDETEKRDGKIHKFRKDEWCAVASCRKKFFEDFPGREQDVY